MISLSDYAEKSMQALEPMISDFEIGLSLSESYSKVLKNFINETFNTVDFDFVDNGAVKTVIFIDTITEDRIELSINTKDTVTNQQKLQLSESNNNSIKFQTEQEFTTLSNLKQSLLTIKNERKKTIS